MLKAIFKMFFWLIVKFLKSFTGIFSILWFFIKMFIIGIFIFFIAMVVKRLLKKDL